MTKSFQKNFINTALAAVMMFPIMPKANGTIQLTFQEGDVVSASVMNGVLSRIQNATSPVNSDDLVGTWNVTQIVPYTGQPGNGGCRLNNSCNISGTLDAADAMTRYRTDSMTIVKNGNTYNFSQANVSSFVSAHLNTPSSGILSAIAETIIFKDSNGGFSYYYAKKKSAEKIVLQDIQSGSGSFNIVILDKVNAPPAPPNHLTASLSGSNVTLTWTDQSTDETGFKVQIKSPPSTTWFDIFTTPANTVMYVARADSTGTHLFRVLSTNAYGDSISSSEVLVNKP
jgi:hypothetical protein